MNPRMVRLYVTPQEVAQSALGIGLSSSLAQFAPGVIDRMLHQASMRADSFCEKRLQAPGSTTLSASASAGDTTISVTSTLTLDELDEQACIIDTGGVQETQDIVPGGVTLASAPTGIITPYPGTITLAAPLQFGHASGAKVQFCYKEITEAGTASQSDPYSEALQTQAAQLALAHLPAVQVGLTRITFLKSYPIQTIYTVEASYSFDTTYNLVYSNSDTTYAGGIIVEPTSGWFRYRTGTVITPQGMIRTKYVGGYQTIPDDVKRAVILLFAEDIEALINPYRLKSMTQGKLSRSWDTKYRNVDEAERILKRYKRSV